MNDPHNENLTKHPLTNGEWHESLRQTAVEAQSRAVKNGSSDDPVSPEHVGAILETLIRTSPLRTISMAGILTIILFKGL